MCLLPKRALHRDVRRNFCVVDFRFLLFFSRPPPPLLCLHLFTFACFFFSSGIPLYPSHTSTAETRRHDSAAQARGQVPRDRNVVRSKIVCVFCDHEFLIPMATNGKVAQQTVQLGLRGVERERGFLPARLPASDPDTTRLSSMQDEAGRTDQGMTRRYSVASWDSTCLLCASTCSCGIKDGVSVLQDGGAEGEKLKRT